jgi:hypothetical protein
VLAFALNDPAFGILYVSLVVVLTAGIVFAARLPLGLGWTLGLLGAAGAGFLLGLALHATRADVSGEAPLRLGRVVVPQPLAPLSASRLRIGPPDGEISVEQFDVDTVAVAQLHDPLVIRSGYGVKVGGWAYDQRIGAPCAAVDIEFDGRLHVFAPYGSPRPDVAAHYFDESHRLTGFSTVISTQGLGPGAHTMRARCLEVPNDVALPSAQPLELRITAGG